MNGSIVRSTALLLALALAGCCAGGGNGGTDEWWEGEEVVDGGPVVSNPITVEEVRALHQDQGPDIVEGLNEALIRAFAAITGGSDQPGVTVTPRGGNRFDVGVEIDMDGNGSRESTVEIDASFEGDPTDGVDESDFPVTVSVESQSTRAGTATGSFSMSPLGTHEFLFEGTSVVDKGDGLVESKEFGYTVNLFFTGVPIYGWECIVLTRGDSRAEYDVSYDSGGDGRQWLGVEGVVDGIPFSFDWGVAPL